MVYDTSIGLNFADSDSGCPCEHRWYARMTSSQRVPCFEQRQACGCALLIRTHSPLPLRRGLTGLAGCRNRFETPLARTAHCIHHRDRQRPRPPPGSEPLVHLPRRRGPTVTMLRCLSSVTDHWPTAVKMPQRPMGLWYAHYGAAEDSLALETGRLFCLKPVRRL